MQPALTSEAVQGEVSCHVPGCYRLLLLLPAMKHHWQNNLLQEDLLIMVCLDKASPVILFLPLFDHLLLCKFRLLNVAKLGSGDGERLCFTQMFGFDIVLAVCSHATSSAATHSSPRFTSGMPESI